MSQSPLEAMKQQGGMSLAKIAAMQDLSLEQVQKSVKSLAGKGLVTGYIDGNPSEVIALTDQGEAFADRMQSSTEQKTN